MSEVTRGSTTISRARLLMVVWLVSAALSVVLLPLVGVTREESVPLALSGLLGVGLLSCAQVLVMWSAVTPWASSRTHRRTQAYFVGAAVASVPLAAPAGAQEWATWAWLGASVIGTTPLLWRGWVDVLVALLTSLTSLGVAVALDGDALTYLTVTLGFGVGLAAMSWAPFSLWERLIRADVTRQADARAAAAHERNRFGRDVHDVLGHDLTVIALKAELAARTAVSDPRSSARESEEVRALAEAALARMRGALVRDRSADIQAEVTELERVLTAAGLRCEIETEPVEVPPTVAAVLSMVLKEATTNALRHSDARRCRVSLDQRAGLVRLVVVNDRPRTPDSTPGTGLVGLRERLAAVDGRLETHQDDASFFLRATVPAAHA